MAIRITVNHQGQIGFTGAKPSYLAAAVKLHTLCICLPYRISGNLLMSAERLSIELNRTPSLGASIKHRTPSLHAKALEKCSLA